LLVFIFWKLRIKLLIEFNSEAQLLQMNSGDEPGCYQSHLNDPVKGTQMKQYKQRTSE